MNERWQGWTLVAFSVAAALAAHNILASLGSPEQPPGETRVPVEEVTVLINMRALGPEEQEIYLRYANLIRTQVSSIDDASFVVTVRELVNSIDGLPAIVQAATRHSLENTLMNALGTELSAREKLGPRHLSELLNSANPKLVRIAISSIRHMPDDWWIENPVIERRLLDLLRFRSTPSDVREATMWSFFLAGTMNHAREAALQLAESDDADLARSAAFLSFAAITNDGFESERVTSLFRDSSGILRQEAALALAQFHDFDGDDTLHREVVLELVSIAKDKAEAPVVRGKAIEQMRRFAQDEFVYRSLVEMLEPPRWFFGVTDNHGPSHSLVAVIEALRGNDSSAIRPLLLKTRENTGDIPEQERVSVERALQISLKRLDENESPASTSNAKGQTREH